MKQKLLYCLSLLLLLASFSQAVGDTFGIVQGSVNSQSTVTFEVSVSQELIDVVSIQPQNNLYAVSLTIPAQYSRVLVTPVIEGVKGESFTLRSGETLRKNLVYVVEENSLDDSVVTSSSSSSSSSAFSFQPEENEQMIEDISKGKFEEYEEEISIMPVPKVVEETERVVEEVEFQEVSQEIPASNPSILVLLNDFFLRPGTLFSIAIIACILIMILVLQGKRSKYL